MSNPLNDALQATQSSDNQMQQTSNSSFGASSSSSALSHGSIAGPSSGASVSAPLMGGSLFSASEMREAVRDYENTYNSILAEMMTHQK